MRSAPRNRTGMALLLVSLLLSMLLVTASMLLHFSHADREGRRASLEETRAGLLARSGIEYASARLSAAPAPRPHPAPARDDWTCRDIPGTRLEEMHNPSWAAGEPYTQDPGSLNGRYDASVDWFAAGDDRNGNGWHDGWSGRLRGTYLGQGDTFALKVEDESGKIMVNGGLLDGGDRDGDGTPDHRDLDAGGWNGQLARVLDLLGARPEVDIPGLGARIVGERPAGGWSSLGRMRATLGIPKDLSPWLTTRAWIDTKVVRPNRSDAAEAVPDTYRHPAEVKRRRGPLRLDEGGRPPVNLNAAPHPVLVALLTGLRGTAYTHGGRPWGNGIPPSALSVRSYTIDPAMAIRIADRIVARRAASPFSSWSDFGVFCDGLVPATISNMGPIDGMDYFTNDGGNFCGADILKANFDPNTHLNKEIPDRLLWRWIDKSDLDVWSTEGCFDPPGEFAVSSVGQVRGHRGRVESHAVRRAGVRIYSLLRQTTQADFVAGRALGDAPRYLSPAAAGPPTAGARLGWGGAPGSGLAVTTYPCAVPALPAAAAQYDGGIGLATIEEPHLNPSAGGTLLFLHHFDDGWDAAVGNPRERIVQTVIPLPSPAQPLQPNDGSLQADPTVGTWPASGVQPSTLQPDGALAQMDRYPAWPVGGNLPSAHLNASGLPANRAAAGFWVKVDGGSARTTYHYFLSMRRWSGSRTQALVLGRNQEMWGMILENRVDSGDIGERGQGARYAGGSMVPDVRWHLVSACFDTAVSDNARDVRFRVQGIRGEGTQLFVNNYGTPYPLSSSQDLLAAGPGPWFYLGGDGLQVVDEIALADLGTDPGLARIRLDTWHEDRYAAGRYYKGNDGTFLSAPLAAPGGAGARLRIARWTAYLPREPRWDLRIPNPVGGGPEATGTPSPIDASLSGSDIGIELVDAAGTALLSTLVQGTGSAAALPATFRYRAVFRPTAQAPWTDPGFPDNNPVLESPYLDDVTLFLQEPSGPRFLSWE